MNRKLLTLFLVLAIGFQNLTATDVPQTSMYTVKNSQTMPEYYQVTQEEIDTLSKVAQILIPLTVVGILMEEKRWDPYYEELAKSSIRNLNKGLEKLSIAPVMVTHDYSQQGIKKLASSYKALLNQLVGLGLFKMAADIVFFSLTNGDIMRAFNIPGLVSFVSVYYLGFHVIRDQIVRAHLFPLYDKFFPKNKVGLNPSLQRLSFILSKWGYDAFGRTVTNVPIREVLLNLSLIAVVSPIAWASSDIGIILAHGLDFSLAPLQHFNYRLFYSYLFSGYFGYIWGHNIGEYSFNRLSLKMSSNKIHVERDPLKVQVKTCFHLAKSLIFSGDSLVLRKKVAIDFIFKVLMLSKSLPWERMASMTAGVTAVGLMSPYVNKVTSKIWFDKMVENFEQKGGMSLDLINQVAPDKSLLEVPLPPANPRDGWEKLNKHLSIMDKKEFPQADEESDLALVTLDAIYSFELAARAAKNEKQQGTATEDDIRELSKSYIEAKKIIMNASPEQRALILNTPRGTLLKEIGQIKGEEK